MAVLSVTDEDFEREVLKADLPVLVDFWAEWCGPCRMISPVVDEIAQELQGRLKVVKVNADEAERWLTHHPKVNGVGREEGVLRFEFAGTDDDLAQIADELFQRKHRPVWIRENRPSLEEVFMRVTKGKVQ